MSHRAREHSRSLASRLRPRLTFANVASALALFFSIGGSAIAAVIVDSNSDVAPDTIAGHAPPAGDHSNIIPGSVNATDLANNSVGSNKINDGGVRNGDIAANTIASNRILDGTIGNVDLASNAVDSGKIADGTVASSDLAFGAVSSDNIADNSVTGADILNRGLSDGDIGSPAQVNAADLPPVGAHSCIALQLNFGGWTQVGELVLAQARDGQLATSGLFITPLVVVTAGSASGRICNLSDNTIDAPPEDILAWSIRQ
jgi:hypothetical protein